MVSGRPIRPATRRLSFPLVRRYALWVTCGRSDAFRLGKATRPTECAYMLRIRRMSAAIYFPKSREYRPGFRRSIE